jgi:hypothetical protein
MSTTFAATATAPARHLRPAPAPLPGPEVAPRRARPASPSARPNLRVVAPGERTLRRLTPLGGILLSAILFVVLAALAGAHTLIAQGQIRLDAVDAKVQDEQARYQQLRKDVAQAEAPERIVAAAEAQGMVAPQDLVYLQPPTDEGVRGTADADASAYVDEAESWDTVKPLLESAP